MKSPVRELRERLELSRAAFAQLVGRGEASVEKYEAELPPDWADVLLKIASKHKFNDLAAIFKRMSGGDQSASGKLDPSTLSAQESVILEALLEMIRDPQDMAEKSLPDLIQGLAQSRTKKIG